MTAKEQNHRFDTTDQWNEGESITPFEGTLVTLTSVEWFVVEAEGQGTCTCNTQVKLREETEYVHTAQIGKYFVGGDNTSTVCIIVEHPTGLIFKVTGKVENDNNTLRATCVSCTNETAYFAYDFNHHDRKRMEEILSDE